VLGKFDGVTVINDAKKNETRRYRIVRLPKFIIFHLKRFTKNNFFMEKNPTIVNFPVKNLELKDYVIPSHAGSVPSREDLSAMSISQLKQNLIKRGISVSDVVEKGDLIERAMHSIQDTTPNAITKYNLLANIVHDSPPDKGKEGNMNPLDGGTYRCHIRNKADEQWYEVQDLHVKEVYPQVIGLSESYAMIFERKE
jgi:U4/U6.U5 tri-snRNP-associated protein 2